MVNRQAGQNRGSSPPVFHAVNPQNSAAVDLAETINTTDLIHTLAKSSSCSCLLAGLLTGRFWSNLLAV